MEQKKKIGLLTFHRSENYGALLQAYALQQVLVDKYQYNLQIIDYVSRDTLQSYAIFNIGHSSIVKKLALFFLTLYRYPELKRKKNKFRFFINQKLFLTSEKYTKSLELYNNPPTFDFYLTGSDQVFNPERKDRNIYYLDFAKGAKIAYAPSFGISFFSEKQKNEIFDYLKEYKSLSCRENAGADFISKIINKKTETVLDPVFLLDVKEWKRILLLPKKENFIFVYDLNGGDDLIYLANKIKEKTGFKIICLTRKVYKKYNVDKQIYDLGPSEFLGYISKAAYVVTDSFHGISFSIIFKVKFIPYIALSKASSRIETLLSSLKLSNLLIRKVDLNLYIFSEKTYANLSYKNELDRLKLKSFEFLTESFK